MIGIPLLLLLFPDGRPPSRRWRPVAWLALGAGVACSSRRLGGVLLPAAMLAALASLVVRYRRAGALERRQLGWFAYAAALIGLSLLAAAVLGALGVPETVTSYLNVLPLAALPLAIGAALARHRLYDLDTLVDRTLVAAALAGSSRSSTSSWSSSPASSSAARACLATLATALVAIAIAPLHARVRPRRGAARLP